MGEKKIERMLIELKQKDKFNKFVKLHYKSESDEEEDQYDRCHRYFHGS